MHLKNTSRPPRKVRTRATRNWVVRIACVATLGLLVSGSGMQSQAQRVTRSFERLQHATKVHDAHTLCELIFPIGRDLPNSALQRAIAQGDSARGRAQLAARIGRCVADTKRDPQVFSQWARLLRGLRVTRVVVHGDIATAHLRSARGTSATKFVKLAGEWRLLFRFG